MYVVDSTFETEVSFYSSHRVLQFLLAYVQMTNTIRFDELGTEHIKHVAEGHNLNTDKRTNVSADLNCARSNILLSSTTLF